VKLCSIAEAQRRGWKVEKFVGMT